MSWKETTVSPCGTHHLLHGEPLYPARFLHVLPFHAPGLAPVQAEDGAFHVDVLGEPAYPWRFLRTFGFYQGRAAVVAEEGWHHILPDGRPLYPERWAWVGNYQQGRCPVRDADGRYRHLDLEGHSVGTRTWRYVGDFREGAAVVQRDDGLCSHVDLDGQPMHPLWFLDLDVFHKGQARARDRGGWYHVDRQGRPTHHRRFAQVEPFYNGQARVEREDGGREVIDEGGRTLVVLRNGTPDTSSRPRGSGDRVAIPWLLPDTLLADLAAIPHDRPVAFLLRHGPRFDVPPGRAGLDVNLLPEGEPLVRHLGGLFGERLASLTSSPVLRCRQTAALMAEGAGRELPVAESDLLGLPGAYVRAGGGAGAVFRAEPYHLLMRRLCGSDEPPPGFQDPAEATGRLLALLLGPTTPGVHAFVSHDSIVGIAMARLTGSFPEPWIRCLEGGFAWREGARAVVLFRGVRAEVTP